MSEQGDPTDALPVENNRRPHVYEVNWSHRVLNAGHHQGVPPVVHARLGADEPHLREHARGFTALHEASHGHHMGFTWASHGHLMRFGNLHGANTSHAPGHN